MKCLHMTPNVLHCTILLTQLEQEDKHEDFWGGGLEVGMEMKEDVIEIIYNKESGMIGFHKNVPSKGLISILFLIKIQSAATVGIGDLNSNNFWWQ